MTVPGRRPQRLAEQIREEISGLMVSGLKDPRIGFATIIEVRLTPDLRVARVLVSVLGTAEEQEETLEGFCAAAGFIRRTLAQQMKLRRVPELEFRLDHTEEQAARIDELLRKTHEGDEPDTE